MDENTSLAERLSNILPAIAERAQEIEDARQLPPDIAKSLAKAGAMRMLTPKSIGGLEVSPQEFVSVLRQISRFEVSSGWCAMIGSTAALSSAYLDPAVSVDMFSDPMTVSAGVFAPMGRADDMGDHYLVNGRWQWGSGSPNCDWLSGGAMIFKDGEMQRFENGAPYHRMMIFPASDAELLNTWHVLGMKGTGSGDFEVQNLKVPKERSVSLIADKPTADGLLYVFPVFGLLAAGISAVALGNAEGAMEEIKHLVKTKKPAGSKNSMAERSTVQVDIARAEAKLGAANAYLRECVDQCWEEAKRDGVLTPASRAQLRLAATHATEISAEVVKTAYTMGGGGSVFLSSSLQRRFRDAHVATQHLMTSFSIYELTGQILLEQKANLAML